MVWGQLVSEFTLLVFRILLLASVQFLLMLLVLLLCKLCSYEEGRPYMHHKSSSGGG